MVNHNIVIADTGPVVHLDEIGCLWLLSDFSVVYIVESVLLELNKHRPLALQETSVNWCITSAQPHKKVASLSQTYSLHTGEMEALALCLERTSALFLTDDTAARLAAKTLNIQSHGTLGILIRAIRRQQMNKLEVLNLLQQLPQLSSLHIKPTLLEEVINQVKAHLN